MAYFDPSPSDATKDGGFSAVVATLGVIDLQKDVLMPGLLREQGAPCIVSAWQHSSSGLSDGMIQPPIGTARLYSDDHMLWANGEFLPTEAGQACRALVVKGRQFVQWSLVFQILARSQDPALLKRFKGARQVITSIDCWEVSPVARGAGLGVRTIEAKDEIAQIADNLSRAVAMSPEQQELQRVWLNMVAHNAAFTN